MPFHTRLMMLGRTWTTLVQWYVEARFSAVASVIAAVQDYKANATLITLVLRFNKVGDAGAIALA